MDIRSMIRKNKWLLPAAIAAAIVFSLYIYLYAPLISETAKRYSECCELEKRAMRARESVERMRSAIVKRALIREEEVSAAIDEVTRAEKERGVNIISIVPKKAEYKGEFKVMPVTVELEAGYEGTAAFLARLDELKRSIVTIESFHITHDEKVPEKCKTRLVVNLYLAK
jgi:Tfp pilus assembly protein PilO